MKRLRIVFSALALALALNGGDVFAGAHGVADRDRSHDPTGASSGLPTFADVRAAHRPSDTLVLDRHGAVLHRLRTDFTLRRGPWVALTDVSIALRTALVLSEDQRFYEHSGVDWRAVSSAAWANLWNTRTRGASTITMQLAGLLDEDLQRSVGGRSLRQKIDQALAARTLERSWRKDQILEAYLNRVPFRGELVGIDALSQTLFGKAAHGLDHREAALAAALVRSPNAAPAQVAQRACGVLRLLEPTPAAPDCLDMDAFTRMVLRRRALQPSEGLAPHVARRVVRQETATTANPASTQAVVPAAGTGASASASASAGKGVDVGAAPPTRSAAGAPITTTLDADLQRFALATMQRHLRELAGRHVEDGALVVLDNRSGAVLAWVGSSGALGDAPEVDGVMAQRQAGSTLKPFLYAQALAERRITAASLLHDASTHIQTAGGLYIPQNYDRQFKGWVSARSALAASLNVPAVRTLAMVSPQAFHDQLLRLGLPLKESGDYYGYSLALGSAEVSLLELTNAYRALANGGRWSPTTLLPLVPEHVSRRAAPKANSTAVRSTEDRPVSRRAAPKANSTAVRSTAGDRSEAAGAAPLVQALDPRAAFIVGDILSDGNARAVTFGTDSVLATRYWSAVKTGTSKDMRDNWALGWSQHFTVGVWVGNVSGAPMWDVSGVSGAAPIWATLMNHLQHNRSSQPPVPPAGVVRQAVRFTAAAGDGGRVGRAGIVGAVGSAGSAGGAGAAPPIEARRDEWFIQGTQQAVFAVDGPTGAQEQGGQVGRITVPTDGTIIALDPDIPPQHQRLRLQAEGAGRYWVIDGRRVASGAMAAWLPWPGRHRLQWVDAAGGVRDEVRIEVRGAGVKRMRGAAP